MYYDSLRNKARKLRQQRQAITQPIPVKELIAPCYLPLHDDVQRNEHLYYFLPGGRGSGKSSFASLEIGEGLREDPTANAIIFRRVGATLRDSVYTQMAWALDSLGLGHLWQGSVSPMQFTNRKTGQQILFRGLDDPAKLKSIKPRKGTFKYCWIEEFSELQGPNSLRSVLQSIVRGGEGFRIFCSFNPPRSRNNWANLYILQPNPQAVTFRTDYTQMPPEWLGDTFIAEAEALKEINETAYRHEYLGEATGTGGEVFPNIVTREITDEEIQGFQYFYAGIDWGFSVDPFAFIRLAYDSKRRTVYLLDEIVQRGLSNADAAQRIIEAGFDKQPSHVPGYTSPFFGGHSGPSEQRIICDSAEPKSVQDMRNAGLLAIGSKKYPGSVQYGVKWLQSKYIVIDPQRTPIALKEFTAYSYLTTKDGEYTTDLEDKDNHLIDATRYALDLLINNGRESA